MAREAHAPSSVVPRGAGGMRSGGFPHIDWSIIAQLEADPGQDVYRLDEISVIQPVLVALAIGYARLLGEFGVFPSAVVGHSMGEVAAATIAGVIDIDRAMEIVCRRSALMQRTSGQGAMAVVELPMSEAVKRLAGWEDRVNVAVSNSPRSCVISGDPEAVRQVMSQLASDGVFCRAVNVDVASHSPQMDTAGRPSWCPNSLGWPQRPVACRSGRRSSADAPRQRLRRRLLGPQPA